MDEQAQLEWEAEEDQRVEQERRRRSRPARQPLGELTQTQAALHHSERKANEAVSAALVADDAGDADEVKHQSTLVTQHDRRANLIAAANRRLQARRAQRAATQGRRSPAVSRHAARQRMADISAEPEGLMSEFELLRAILGSM